MRARSYDQSAMSNMLVPKPVQSYPSDRARSGGDGFYTSMLAQVRNDVSAYGSDGL